MGYNLTHSSTRTPVIYSIIKCCLEQLYKISKQWNNNTNNFTSSKGSRHIPCWWAVYPHPASSPSYGNNKQIMLQSRIDLRHFLPDRYSSCFHSFTSSPPKRLGNHVIYCTLKDMIVGVAVGRSWSIQRTRGRRSSLQIENIRFLFFYLEIDNDIQLVIVVCWCLCVSNRKWRLTFVYYLLVTKYFEIFHRLHFNSMTSCWELINFYL